MRTRSVTQLIEKAQADFVVEMDGFVYYAPVAGRGHFNAWMLRALADELDRRNAAWEAEIEHYFEQQNGQDTQGELDFKNFD